MFHDVYCNHSYNKKANHSYHFLCNHAHMETMAKRIYNRRIEKKLTQDEVAKRVGVSRVAVTKWENGQTGNLKLDNLIKLCKLLDISFEYLINGGDLKTYASANNSNEDDVKKEFGIKTEDITLIRAQVHQEIDKLPDKDLIHVKKIIGTYDGVERRAKPRTNKERSSNK